MSIDFIMPDIGEGIVECELLKWLVKEGDIIKEDQPVAEVMTDKATVEIPAMQNGLVEKLYYSEGDIAKVHQPLFRLSESEVVVTSSNGVTPGKQQDESSSAEAAKSALQRDVFLLPDIGEGIVECEIVKWCVQENDAVEEDQVVVEVMTDKAVVEIPAKHAGKITKLFYGEGDIAKVHSPLFELSLEVAAIVTECPAVASMQHQEKTQQSSVEHFMAVSRVTQKIQEAGYRQGENHVPITVSSRPIASPAVRRLAKEHGIDLTRMKGSGAKGRVLKKDVISAIESLSRDLQETNATACPSVSRNQSEAQSTEPLTGIGAAMLNQMKDSAFTIPHFSVSDELEMDALIALRQELKPTFEKDGIHLSFMPFFIKALSMALGQYPIINSRVSTDEKAIHYIQEHNIGLAIDSSLGLLVPNIKNVQTLSLKDIAVEVNRLIDAGRAGRLSARDLTGGTITISNIGVIGGITATPIINKPEVAIVALGKTRKLPRFDDNDNVVAKHIMHVNWSGDHRIIDGATMVKFNNCWLNYLTHPEKMLIELR